MTSDILKRAAEAVDRQSKYGSHDSDIRTLIMDMAAAIAERDADNERLTARAEAAEAMADADADLLLDAYKALLVLHRMLDKHGLTAGVEAANSLANRIVAAHPEMPGRAAMKEGR